MCGVLLPAHMPFASLMPCAVMTPDTVLPAVFSSCRLGTIALLFAPVVGWVGFNMAQPFFNQMNRMNEIKSEAAGASTGKKGRR
jgi:hypothetical protein